MAQPNILIVMVDQLTGTLFPDGPAGFLQAPNLRRLAQHALRFSQCHTASPVVVPGQAAALTGQMPRRMRVYDAACTLAPDIPTYAHHLRRAGYYTALQPGIAYGFDDWFAPPPMQPRI